MNARDIMTPNPFVLVPDDPIWKAAELMKHHNIGGVPVVRSADSPHMVGVITDRDIAVRCVARRHATGCKVSDHMTPQPLHTIQPDELSDEIVRKMEEGKCRRLPVVDSSGLLVGMVTETDLVMKLPQSFALLARKRVKLATPPSIAKL
jgi:CBS domain-containing protein